MSNRSRDELFRFLDYVRSKGLMNPATVEARKASANKVLGILDAEEAKDVTTIDLDAVVDRFSNLHGKQYTPDSLRSYKSRTRSAIQDFARYVDNPLAFKPNVQRRDSRPEQSTERSQKRVGGETNAATPPPSPERAAVVPAASSNILPIPLRADLTVYIQGLPFDLTASEAKKLAGVIQAMAMVE